MEKMKGLSNFLKNHSHTQQCGDYQMGIGEGGEGEEIGKVKGGINEKKLQTNASCSVKINM